MFEMQNSKKEIRSKNKGRTLDLKKGSTFGKEKAPDVGSEALWVKP